MAFSKAFGLNPFVACPFVFGLGDCTALVADGVALPVRWSAGERLPGSLAGTPIRLQFELQQADLYGFQLEAWREAARSCVRAKCRADG